MPSSAMKYFNVDGEQCEWPVTPPMATEDVLRAAIRARDSALTRLTECDRIIAEQSRIYADERGLTVKPNLDQLRRELFRT